MPKTKEKEPQIKDEMKEEMLDLIGESREPESVQTPEEKEGVVAKDVEEKPPEEPEQIEEAAEEEVVEKKEPEKLPEVPEPEVAEVEETELSKAQKEVALYKAQLETLAGNMLERLGTPSVQDIPVGEKPAVETKPPEPATVAEPTELVDEETYEKLLQDRSVFNTFINSVIANTSKTARTAAVTDILRMLPAYNAQQRGREKVVEGHINDFWKQNEDLKAMPKYVGITCTGIESKHPDWPIDQVLEETAKVVRKELALQEKVKEEASPEGVKPVGMPRLTSTRKPPAKLKEGLAKEMEDLVRDIDPGGIL